jgi:ThiF family
MADMFVKGGMGKLTLVDPDVFSEENLARHILTPKYVGEYKVKALMEHLSSLNEDCKIRAFSMKYNERDLASPIQSLRDVDLIVSAVDSYECESMINADSLRQNIPTLYVGCWGEASVGEIYYVLPGETPCLECYAAFRKKQDIDIPAEKYTDPNYDFSRVPGQAGLWANILIIAGMGFRAAMGIFTNDLPNRNLWLMNIASPDLRPLGVTFGTVKKGCAVCDDESKEVA